MDESKNWYIVYTLQGQEKKVTEILSKKKIESYCPLNATHPGHWKKTVYEPLFNSYCFVKIFEGQIPVLRQTNGVISLIYWLSKPVTVPDEEMNAIKQFLYEYRAVKVQKIRDDKILQQNNSFSLNSNNNLYSADSIAKVELPSLGYLITAEEKALNQVIIKPLFPRRRSIMQRIVG